jgi:hypothetical protein
MRALATDSEGHELRVNDAVREVDGEVNISARSLRDIADLSI